MDRVLGILYQRYRLIALAVYTAVLLAGFLDSFYAGIGPAGIIDAPENYRFLIFVISVFILIASEVLTFGKAGFLNPNKIEYTPFLIRVSLFITACLVTDISYSQILFLPILLYSYLAMDSRLSYFMAILGVAILFGVRISDISDMGKPPLPAPPIAGIPPTEIPITAPLRGGRLIDESMGTLITLFFTLLLARAMAQAIQAQQKTSDLFISLNTSHTQLKQYSIRVAELAATEERNRLARDIHDSLGHHLVAINIQLEKANAYRERDLNRAYEAVNHAQRSVQDALKDVRASVSSLRHDNEPFVFQDAVDKLLNRMRHSRLEIIFNQTGQSSRYSRLKLMTLYRVIQEGLTNIHKHANASRVNLSLDFDSQQAILKLIDNGSGFDVTTLKRREREQTTQGLIGLQERLSLVGGTFNISSCPQATILRVSIPRANPQVHVGLREIV